MDKTRWKTNDEFYNDVMSHDKIFSLLYSPNKLERYTTEEQIEEIETMKLKWYDDKSKFVFVYGCPGPDWNLYSPETYGKGWAFTKEEIIDAWEKERKVEK